MIDSLEQVLTSGKLNQLEKAELLQNLSHEYMIIDSAKCRKYAMEALKVARNIGSKKMEGLALNALGNHFITFNPYLAHVHYKKAEKIFLELNDRENLYHKSYHNLMLLFAMIDDMNNSAYYAGKILEMAAEMEGTTNIFEAHFFIGLARFKDNAGYEVLDYYLDIYRKAIMMKPSLYTQYIAWNCGKIFIRQNRPREALQYLHWVRESFESNNMNIIPEGYASLAEAYAMLKKADSAEYYIKKTLDAVPMINNEARLILLRTRYLLESGKGDHKSALEKYKIYHHFSDSVLRAGKTAEIGRMKNWFELEQKDNENMLLQQERQKQHRLILILVVALIMILTLLILSILFFRRSVEKNRDLKNLNFIKDKLFSIVAHDLRSPMNALMTMLRLFNIKKIDPETQARLLKELSMRVDGTFGLLDNLLRWAKSQMQGMVPSPASFDTQEESQAITDTLLGIADAKQITLENRIGKHQVYVDRDMFGVVVRNLTTNAIKYSSANETVILDSELSDNMLVISVKDTGTGMSQEVQNHLFKLSETQSQRGTNNETGTGLGLVLCADFVKANGGTIWFTSKQGEGSTFFFSIPIKI